MLRVCYFSGVGCVVQFLLVCWSGGVSLVSFAVVCGLLLLLLVGVVVC